MTDWAKTMSLQEVEAARTSDGTTQFMFGKTFESISKAVTVTGVYTIVIKPYACVDASYDGLVHLA